MAGPLDLWPQVCGRAELSQIQLSSLRDNSDQVQLQVPADDLLKFLDVGLMQIMAAAASEGHINVMEYVSTFASNGWFPWDISASTAAARNGQVRLVCFALRQFFVEVSPMHQLAAHYEIWKCCQSTS